MDPFNKKLAKEENVNMSLNCSSSNINNDSSFIPNIDNYNENAIHKVILTN